jgi:hypothetical protein
MTAVIRRPDKRAAGQGGIPLLFMLAALGPPCLSTIVRHEQT